jgi:hypothetical protein
MPFLSASAIHPPYGRRDIGKPAVDQDRLSVRFTGHLHAQFTPAAILLPGRKPCGTPYP